MYIVRNSQGDVVAITTRREDAEAYLAAQHIDDTYYTIEEQKVVDSTAE